MKKIVLNLVLILASTFLILSCSSENSVPNNETKTVDAETGKSKATTLILVRHAEKFNDTDTSTLTETGMSQAKKLASILQNTDINNIYTTPFARCRMTVIPTAMSKNLEIIDYQQNKMEEIDVMINENIGKTALIVGHKTTIPEILNKYLNTKYTDLDGHGDIFILHIDNSNSKANSVTHLFYE